MSTSSPTEGRTSRSRGDWNGKASLRAVLAPLPSKVGDSNGRNESADACIEGDADSIQVVRCPAWSEPIPSEAASATNPANRLYQDDDDHGAPNDEVMPKIFTRRALSPSKADSRAMLRGCCDRCKSDLNGKLLARCSVCGFCRHLYCFSPPLKQHPALEERPDAKRRVSATVAQSMIAQWKCGDCARNLSGRASLPAHQGQQQNEDAQVKSKPLKKRPRRAAPPVNGPSAASPRRLINIPVTKQAHADGGLSLTDLSRPMCSPGRDEPLLADGQRLEEFDWYTFRSQKAARVLNQPGAKDELVYYSWSVALMRKTARFWHKYAQQKRLRSHLSAQRHRWVSGPQIYDVKHILGEEDHAKLEASRHRRKTEEADAIRLFADENTGATYYRPPRRDYLITAPDAEERVDGVGEALIASDAVSCMLAEVVERVAMEREDEDHQDEPAICEGGYESSHPSILGLHLAAKVIQQFVRLRRKARDRVQGVELGPQAESQLEVDGGKDRAGHQMDAERLTFERRRARANAYLQRMTLCAKFVGILLARFRQRQKKKVLVALLADPTPRPATPEDTSATENALDEETAAVERRRAAQSRIMRFFRKFVGPRVYRRKFVMSRRIQRWWKLTTRRRMWTALVSSYRLHVRNMAGRRIQRSYRKYRVKRKFQLMLEKLAFRRLRLFLRQWIMSRLVKKERERVQLYSAAMRLNSVPDGLVGRPEASVLEILDEVGMTLYSAGDFWSAAFVFEKHAKARGSVDAADLELMVAFAYSHHMTWYSSYDASNLMRAHDLYCSALECASAKRAADDEPSVVDPDVLQDLALVKMHMGDTGGSLRLLATLIEFFPREPSLPLWLLLAAVQLQQRGEWEQSVQYLTYVQDMPPAPYLERDMLLLCAIGLQRCGGRASASARKEAWRAALRLWSMDKKTREGAGHEVGGQSRALSAQTRLKWEAVADLAQRALAQGHYLLSIQTYTHAMTRFADAADPYERGTAWWNLADAYRHLGRLDLYLDAAVRSQQCGGAEQPDEGMAAAWKEHAARSSRSFQDELARLSAADKLQQLEAQQ